LTWRAISVFQIHRQVSESSSVGAVQELDRAPIRATQEGDLPFQRYFVERRADVNAIRFAGADLERSPTTIAASSMGCLSTSGTVLKASVSQ
jgi:hypothetical protein